MSFRFSPSPTGKLHIGSARTALISYVLSQQTNAPFIYRIEDTDVARSTKAFEVEMMDSLKWLGMTSDEAPIRQSDQESSGIYKEIAQRLIDAGLAYYCNCSKLDLKKMKVMQLQQKKPLGYEGTCRAYGNPSGVLRLDIGAVRMFLEPNEHGGGKDLYFHDAVYGDRHIDIRDLRDIVLLRTDGTATYLMANTVDDTLSGVTDIVRGADLLPQTAIQILLRKVLVRVMGLNPQLPAYTHVPLVLGETGEKLSKRSKTTKSIKELEDEGILPEAIIQFVLGVGNNSVLQDSKQSLEDIVKTYDSSQNAKKNVRYSDHQMYRINKLHIQAMTHGEINEHLRTSYEAKLIDVCKYRVNTMVLLKQDLEKTQMILKTFDNDLDQLQSNDFNDDACQLFRLNKLGGESSMSLKDLASLR